MRKKYLPISITALAPVSEASILAGSDTNQTISVAKVDVVDFDYGFSNDNGLNDSGFEVTFDY